MQTKTLRNFIFALSWLTALFAGVAAAAETPEKVPEQVIEPQIDRRDVHIPKIRASDIEIGYYTGRLSVEDFGAESSSGYRIGYHVTEDFFIEGMRGTSLVSDLSFRRLGIPILRKPTVDLTYSYVSIGYNMFPGEVFIGKSFAMTSAVYLVGGVGNVNFNDEDLTPEVALNEIIWQSVKGKDSPMPPPKWSVLIGGR